MELPTKLRKGRLRCNSLDIFLPPNCNQQKPTDSISVTGKFYTTGSPKTSLTLCQSSLPNKSSQSVHSSTFHSPTSSRPGSPIDVLYRMTSFFSDLNDTDSCTEYSVESSAECSTPPLSPTSQLSTISPKSQTNQFNFEPVYSTSTPTHQISNLSSVVGHKVRLHFRRQSDTSTFRNNINNFNGCSNSKIKDARFKLNLKNSFVHDRNWFTRTLQKSLPNLFHNSNYNKINTDEGYLDDVCMICHDCPKNQHKIILQLVNIDDI